MVPSFTMTTKPRRVRAWKSGQTFCGGPVVPVDQISVWMSFDGWVIVYLKWIIILIFCNLIRYLPPPPPPLKKIGKMINWYHMHPPSLSIQILLKIKKKIEAGLLSTRRGHLLAQTGILFLILHIYISYSEHINWSYFDILGLFLRQPKFAVLLFRQPKSKIWLSKGQG